jgi:hypothetical protein
MNHSANVVGFLQLEGIHPDEFVPTGTLATATCFIDIVIIPLANRHAQ